MKLRVKNFKRFANFMAIMLIALTVFYFSSATDSYSSTLPNKIVVENGDTLWNIAERYYPNDYLPKITYEIERINNLVDGRIYPGQTLILP